jgi:hypothetical protein
VTFLTQEAQEALEFASVELSIRLEGMQLNCYFLSFNWMKNETPFYVSCVCWGGQ